MATIHLIATTLAITFGAFATAALFCALCWALCRIVHHPEWGPAIVLIGLVAAFGSGIAKNEFLRMSAIFAAIAAITLWLGGPGDHHRGFGARRR